jgi:hypothetical protein
MNQIDSRMRKGYLARWKRREKPENCVTDYWFSFSPEKAAIWETTQEAEKDCAIFNRFGIDTLAEMGTAPTYAEIS